MLNKIIKIFKSMNSKQKVGVAYLAEVFFYACVVLPFGSEIGLYLFLATFFMTVIVDVYTWFYDDPFKENAKKELEMLKRVQDKKEAELLRIKELYKNKTVTETIEELNSQLKDLNPNGSIIRDSKEIAKEKAEYISLLELIEKYERLENIKEIETPELPTINFDDISNTSRCKK